MGQRSFDVGNERLHARVTFWPNKVTDEVTADDVEFLRDYLTLLLNGWQRKTTTPIPPDPPTDTKEEERER